MTYQSRALHEDWLPMDMLPADQSGVFFILVSGLHGPQIDKVTLSGDFLNSQQYGSAYRVADAIAWQPTPVIEVWKR